MISPGFVSWAECYPESDPYAKREQRLNQECRDISLSEFDAVDGSHQLHRNVPDSDRPRGAA